MKNAKLKKNGCSRTMGITFAYLSRGTYRKILINAYISNVCENFTKTVKLYSMNCFKFAARTQLFTNLGSQQYIPETGTKTFIKSVSLLFKYVITMPGLLYL